jgi:hypothetical protein
VYIWCCPIPGTYYYSWASASQPSYLISACSSSQPSDPVASQRLWTGRLLAARTRALLENIVPYPDAPCCACLNYMAFYNMGGEVISLALPCLARSDTDQSEGGPCMRQTPVGQERKYPLYLGVYRVYLVPPRRHRCPTLVGRHTLVLQFQVVPLLHLKR